MFLKRLINRPRTLAFRLTLWYAAIFTISSFLAFLIFYLSVASVVQGRSDDEILEEIRELTHIFPGGINEIEKEVIHEVESEDAEDIFFRILTLDGSVVIESDLSSWGTLEIDANILKRLNRESSPVLQTLSLPEKSYKARVAYAKISPDYIMQAGTLLKEETRIMTVFRKVFSTTMIMVSLLAALTGWFMAKRALIGIEDVTRTAQQIAKGGAMNQRVSAKAEGDEIERLASTFNHMLDRIQNVIKEMKEMSDNIAHDLKSPITSMRGIAEVTLTTGSSIDEYKHVAANTIEECDYLLDMINTMLEISETEAGVNNLEIRPIDLSELVRDVCDLFLPLAERKNIAVNFEVPKTLIVDGDLRKLQRMIANLLDNALKYTADSGKVTLSLYENEKHQVILSINDTGIGIPEKDIPNIFQRFYRCDRSRSKRGCGLGLSLVKAIVKSHHGDVSVHSHPSTGSTFTVTLPRRPTL